MILPCSNGVTLKREAVSMAAGFSAPVHRIAGTLYDVPPEGCSGERLAQATGLSVRDIHYAVDWLEGSGYARVDRALGGSPSLHLFVAIALTARGRRAYAHQRL